MKKSALFTLFILVSNTLFYILLFNSCQKTSVNQIDDQIFETQDENLVQHMLNIKEKMKNQRENPILKNSGLLTADSAIWEIESQLNFNFCYNNIDILQKSLEEFEVVMPLNSQQKITFSELVALYYNIIIDSIQVKMTNLNFVNKKLLLVDLEQTGTTTQGYAIISVVALVGNQQNVVLHDDNWWYGEYYGMCNGNNAPEDAATQLDTRVTNAMLPSPPSGCRWSFTNIETDGSINPQEDQLDETPDNYLDYKIFFATTENDLIIDYSVKCLSQFEMSFYKDYYVDYASAAEVDNPGKKFTHCMIVGEEKINPYRIQHTYTIFVGNRFLLCDIGIDDIMSVE